MPVVSTAKKNSPSNRASLLRTASYLVSSSVTLPVCGTGGGAAGGYRTLRFHPPTRLLYLSSPGPGNSARPAIEDERVQREGGSGGAAPRAAGGTTPAHPRHAYRWRPRFASIAALPSAPFFFQSFRISARTRASVLATMCWFSRSSLR